MSDDARDHDRLAAPESADDVRITSWWWWIGRNLQIGRAHV